MADVTVKMLVPMASAKNDRDAGAIVTVSASEAERLIEKGFAEPADGSAGGAKRGRKAAADKNED